MKKHLSIALALVMLLALLAGCSSGTSSETTPSAAPPSQADETSSAAPAANAPTASWSVDDVPEWKTPDKYLENSLGMVGAGYDELVITDAQKEEIRALNLTVALIYHTTGDDYTAAHLAGVKSACEDLNIEIVAQTNANFKAEQMAIDIENAMALDPDLMIAIPIEETALSSTWKNVCDAGIHLAFNEYVPDGLTADDFAIVTSGDAYGNGVAAARVMAASLGGKGDVALFSFTNPAPSNMYRVYGFTEYMEANFPDINIVTDEGFTDVNKVAELADAVFAKFPDLNGAWGAWDIPAEAVMSAAKNHGLANDEFSITCVDLGLNAARVIAEDGMIKGLGAQQPFASGRAQLLGCALAAIGADYPKSVALPPVTVTKENLPEAWELVYAAPLPDEIKSLLS